MKCLELSNINFVSAPFEELKPVNFSCPKQALSLFWEFEGQWYKILSGAHQTVALGFEGSLDELIHLLVDLFDWQAHLHPLDLLALENVWQNFSSQSFRPDHFFEISEQSLEQLNALRSLSEREIHLIRNQKMDLRLVQFLHSHGFKMNEFFFYCFEKGSFNYAMQMKIVEHFSKLFRRKKLDASDFLGQVSDELNECLGNKSRFREFLECQTSPTLFESRKERASKVQKLNQISGISRGNIRFDESLEDPWLEITFRVESSNELVESTKGFESQRFRQLAQELLED